MLANPGLATILATTVCLWTSTALAASKVETKPPRPCTIRSSVTDKFFDLNQIAVKVPKAHKDDREESWQARGYDFPANFTLNICAPVVEKVRNVVGVDEDRWQNVSAYYVQAGKTYSIGQQNSELVFRGRKLVLNYTDGSPCTSGKPTTLQSRTLSEAFSPRYRDDDEGEPDLDTDGEKSEGREGDSVNVKEKAKGKGKDKVDDEDDDYDGGDNDDDEDGGSGSGRHRGDRKTSHPPTQRRKSTIISLLCDNDLLAANTMKASVAFIGASPDQCTYFFEARSYAACGGIEAEKQTLSPAGVFGVIALIAVIVYFVGGCMYQRNVMHQRGWRQLPNYSMWRGVASFVTDIIIIATSSCLPFLPWRRRYSRVALNGNAVGRNSSDDENRLIDQLDEDWDE